MFPVEAGYFDFVFMLWIASTPCLKSTLDIQLDSKKILKGVLPLTSHKEIAQKAGALVSQGFH
jgi:hypothetical protein